MNQQMVIFQVADKVYSIERGQVQRILPMQAVFARAGAYPFIEGVSQVDGQTVPIIDLAKYFALPSHRQSRTLLIIEAEGQGMGLAVDRVIAVVQLEEHLFEPPFPLVTPFSSAPLWREGRKGKGMLLMSLEYAFSQEEREALLRVLRVE